MDRLCDTTAWAVRKPSTGQPAKPDGRSIVGMIASVSARWFRRATAAALVALLVSPHLAAADPGGPLGSVVGVIRVNGSSKVLVGSRIEVITDGSIVYSDSTGQYQLASLPAGPVELRVTRDGYAPLVLDVIVPAGGVLRVDVSLAPQQLPLIAKQTAELAPVTVVSMAKIAIGSWADDLGHQYRGAQLWDGPLMTGEPDILRALGTDPRVTVRPDGPPMLRAPGVDGARMQVLLDGLPIWNTLHGGAMLSAVTPDAVAQIATHDGALPARFAGTMGDVVDVRTRDLTNDVSTGRIAVGPEASRAMWGTPIQAGTLSGSMLIAMRASHSALFTHLSDRQPFIDRWIDGVARLSLSNRSTTVEMLAFTSDDRTTQTTVSLHPYTALSLSRDVWADGDAWPPDGGSSGGTGTATGGTTGTAGGTSGGAGSATGSATGGTWPSTGGGAAPATVVNGQVGVPTIPWSSRTVGALWTQRVAPGTQLETRAWVATLRSAVQPGVDTAAFWLPCSLDDAMQHLGASSTLQWRTTAIGASLESFDTRYHVTNISWVIDSGTPLSIHTAPRVGAVYAEHKWGTSDDPVEFSTGLRTTGMLGHAWYLEPRASALVRIGERVTAALGYTLTHQFVQSLRNDVSPLRAIVGADFPVAAGANGVPVARTEAITSGIATRITTSLTLDLDAYHRTMAGVALADPVDENLFAVASFGIARANVTGAGAALTGDDGLFQWHLSYGIARTAVHIANNTTFNAAPVVGRSAAASVAMAVTTRTRLQVAGWAATNQQAAQLTQSYDNAQWAQSGGALSAWLPKYRRVDVTASHSYDIPQHGTLAMFVTAANIFNGDNVATFLRARSTASATGTASASVWQPVTLVPRSLQAGLSWQY